MRQLVLLRGQPASGKTYFIEQLGLTEYALSPDVLRGQYSSPTYSTDGKRVVNQSVDGKVWDTLREILEMRMHKGEFIIIDATHSTSKLINQYKELVNKYGYRTFVVNMNTSLEESLENNRKRPEYKYVPEEVIENMHNRLEHENVTSFAKEIDKGELVDNIKWLKRDYDNYSKVHVIGDVHGCFTALHNTFNYDYIINNKDECFVFVGDYFDRGLENGEMFEFLELVCELPNVVLLEGNHEKHLKSYAYNSEKELHKVKDEHYNSTLRKLYGKQFREYTLPEFELRGITPKRARKLCRKLQQVLHFRFNNQDYVVNHGGILPNMVDNLNLVATDQVINGVGGYEFEIDDQWENSDTIQIHGHRNIYRRPLKVENSINLEGRVEKGGHLRAVTISKEGIETIETPNTLFDNKFLVSDDYNSQIDKELTVDKYIELAREDRKTIKVIPQYGKVKSVNFTEKAFRGGSWNQLTVTARGLFLKEDRENSKVLGRGYNKFFNINERKETKIENMVDTLKYPLVGYRKENGFLGILYYDSDIDELIFASKSRTHLSKGGNEYALRFKEIFENQIASKEAQYQVLMVKGKVVSRRSNIDIIKSRLKNTNQTLVFEVIDVENDPHIVEYDKSHIVLLDAIKNKLQFEKEKDTNVLKDIASMVGCDCKKKELVFNDWQEFYDWYKNAKDDLSIQHEGWVFEDNNGFMFKFKSKWYSDWKYIRGAVVNLTKHHLPDKVKQYILMGNKDLRDFYYWAKTKPVDELYKDIITLRKEFYNENKS